MGAAVQRSTRMLGRIGRTMQETSLVTDKAEVVLRECSSLTDFESCMELQRRVWQYGDLDITPSAILVVVVKSGGHVIGAFDGDAMVGFVLGFAAFHGNERYIHSHMTVVSPSYHNHGIGKRLKLRQREICRAQGIQRVVWTFDPLELKNAFFNIVRLGVMVREALPNVYGVTTSHLHGRLPTDRLVAEWRIDTPRVERILAGEFPVLHSAGSVTVPADIGRMRSEDPLTARREQERILKEFEHWFSKGYMVSGFERDGDNARYLMEVA